MERLRVARALASLPVIEDALANGGLNFSAVRELTRVATPATEARWCERALGKNVRQIEELVAGHMPGDDPDDPADPVVQRHKVMLDLSAEVFARWRQTQTAVADARGARPDDDAFAIELMEAWLNDGKGGEPTGRAKFQIMFTLCKQCERGWQEGAGRQVPVDAATVERAKCDAQYVGSIDDKVPARATQDIPPSVARFVWRRDGGRCSTPGCRSTRCLEIHHKMPRAQGGSHDPDNLCLLCWGCHTAVHRGTLVFVDGVARRTNEPKPTPLDTATVRAQARDALVGLGWKPAIARTAVDEAMSHVGSEPLDVVIREALRRCPRPTT